MKFLLLFPLLSIYVLLANKQSVNLPKSKTSSSYLRNGNRTDTGLSICAQADPGYESMTSAVFKSQQYCRAEVKDFEFDAPFIIVSASVYFTGANFKSVEKGNIISSSLKPISNLMSRCIPGSIIIFDDVKVIGPDKKLRTIPGTSIRLR